MGFWWLALKDALIIGRDRKALLTLVFMPILLIGILGAAFGNMLGDEEPESIKKFSVAVVNLDEGEFGGVLQKDVLMEGLPELVSAQSMTEKEMEEQLKQQKMSVGIIIPSDFTNHIISGDEAEVKIVSIPSASIQSMIVENIVSQFTQSAAVNVIGRQMALPANTGADSDVPAVAVQEESFKMMKEEAVSQDQQPVSSFQYYAAGMGVMFLMMTVITGVSAMIEEKEQDVYNRLLVSQLTNYEYLFGKFIGLLFMSSVQFMIIILGTSALYGVHWGESFAGVTLLGIAFVFSVSGLGVLLGSLVKTEKTFNAVGMLVTQIMAAVGGSMVPLYAFPDWLNELVKILPNALALQTFLELMSGGRLSNVLAESGALFAIGFGSLAIAAMVLSRRRRALHA
ncbi:ABC transporter permease [Mesobacillus subterraneus]|uniref:ABC transporter permease n=1 Tax=Mesobacillus subterraneus TaxID=285983 RepID=A0A427TI11_9BACI|nr:ABC transporter permease [Mesobacillus subterraneus]RSD23035.1 ABC transporter permease [Mesobacillus subterraneus]